MWLMIANLNANKVNSCEKHRTMNEYTKENRQWFVASTHKFRRLVEECTSPHHSVRHYVCFHQHLSLEENKICPSPMTTGVPVVWFESITLLILWRLWTNSRVAAWRIVLLHTPYVLKHYVHLFMNSLCLRSCDLGERTQDGPNPCQEFGPGTFPAGCGQKPGLLS